MQKSFSAAYKYVLDSCVLVLKNKLVFKVICRLQRPVIPLQYERWNFISIFAIFIKVQVQLSTTNLCRA